MRKSSSRSITKRSQEWTNPENEIGVSKGAAAASPLPSAGWLPESALRDALIAETLPTALAGENLFWINVVQYLNHQHAQLPPEEYLRHWREVYRSCLNRDTTRLSELAYLSVHEPKRGSGLN